MNYLMLNYARSIKLNYNSIYYFFIYSFIGWCIETVYVSISQSRFVFRGFLYGPLCPIYGFGALIILFALEPVKNNVLLFLFSAVFFTSSLEYFTGFILQAAFNSVIWDYSTELLNLQGRISLKFSLIWGLLSLFFVRILHPGILRLLKYIPDGPKEMFSNIILIGFVIDSSLTLFPLLKLDLEIQHVEELLSQIANNISQGKP